MKESRTMFPSQYKNSILIFSGRKRSELMMSEGSIYYMIAKYCNYFENKILLIKNRTFIEDYALDSFQNLLFSICRFYQITSNYPSNIKLISWLFKKYRFENLHIKAIKYPLQQFIFYGINGNYTNTLNDYINENIAIDRFIKDIYGCSNEVQLTRTSKNLFYTFIPYPNGCIQLKPLFNLCQDGFNDILLTLPWSKI